MKFSNLVEQRLVAFEPISFPSGTEKGKSGWAALRAVGKYTRDTLNPPFSSERCQQMLAALYMLSQLQVKRGTVDVKIYSREQPFHKCECKRKKSEK